MAARSNITNEELLSNLWIDRLVAPDSSRYVVVVHYRAEVVGHIEKKFGKWHIVGNDEGEIRDLIEAIRKVVNMYIDSEEEFNDLRSKIKAKAKE